MDTSTNIGISIYNSVSININMNRIRSNTCIGITVEFRIRFNSSI